MTLRINYLNLPIVLPIVLSIVAAALLASQPASAQRYADLESCELAAGGGRLTVTARCGTLEVAENPDDPDTRRIELSYAIVPARASQVQPDPVFFLAGGPGQSARDVAPIISTALRDVNRDRDLIFLDQRGTGGSNRLDCLVDDAEEWLEMDFDRMDQELQQCQQQWDADVRYYTTADAARDLDQLRQHLEFEQINLVGGSYGTRMAQAYLRHYPDAVRSVVIDGVVPTRLHLGSEHGMKLDQSLYRLFDQCREDATCAERFPDLDQALQNLIAHYQQETEALIVTHPRTGQGIPVDFSNDVLASALRFLAYNPQTQMIIPYLIHEAATTGSPSRLASQALIVQDQMSDQIAIGLNFAVGCSEDWPGWPHDLDQSGTLLGNSMREFYETVCAWWPAGEVADDFHQPFASDVPMLVLSGELDPVTPPEYGDEAAEQFDNSLHLVGRGLGHIVLGQPCFGKIITQFIDQASVGDLDTDCLDQLGPEPFFVDLLGPTP